MTQNRFKMQQETEVKASPSAIFVRGRGLRLARALAAFAVCCGVCFAGWGRAAGTYQLGRDVTALPPAVQRMRQAILMAAASGDIEQLRVPIEMNEIHPLFAKTAVPDPIAYLKAASADGNGREILAILYSLLTTGYAITNPGTKDETIVWPYHAAIPLGSLTPSQEVELYRFLPPKRLKEMIAQGKYSFYSIGIGRDGVWHYFWSG
jgi:hypothetical protein